MHEFVVFVHDAVMTAKTSAFFKIQIDNYNDSKSEVKWVG